MAKRRSVEQKLADLAALRDAAAEPDARPAVLASLRRELGDRSNLVVAKAARLAAELGADDCASELADAFGRFLTDPLKTDKGCRAKTAIVECLVQFDRDEGDVFVRGIRHVQREPSYGGPVDTAAVLRGQCALGLAESHHPRALTLLTELLADREPDARVLAVRALVRLGRPEVASLLRYKTLAVPDGPEVLTECFAALLVLEPEESLAFVAGYLSTPSPEVQDAAAVALGESRLSGAFEALRGAWEARRLDPEPPQTVLLAMATLRREEAMDYLWDLVREGSARHAAAAVRALAIHRHDANVIARLREAVANRGESEVREALE